MASKKDKLNKDDIDLFRKAVKDTTPLRQKSKKVDNLSAAKPKKALTQTRDTAENRFIDELDTKHDVISEMDTPQVAAADILVFSRPGIQNKLLQKLRRGQIPIEADLDLHGMRVKDANAEITAFLNYSLSSGLRCIKIIHGKGRGGTSDMPILKNSVNTWLRQIPYVLAFCSAQPNDGGIGAVYILLKKV